MRNKILLFFLLSSFSIFINAQNISVESFRLLETDMTANNHGTIEYDQNGDIAALIKIITTETGFAYDGGMMGIVKVEQKVSEIWVYVPHGIQKIKIMHQQLGQLEYYFPTNIESARTYEMKLTSQGTIHLECSNTEAELYLNNEFVGIGSWMGKRLPGSYQAEARIKGFQSRVISFSLNVQEEKSIALPPPEASYGSLLLTSSPDNAVVFIDGLEVGKTPFIKRDLAIGNHDIELKKEDYKSYKTIVKIDANEVKEIVAELNLLDEFDVTITTVPSKSTISINGVSMGLTPYRGKMTTGDYELKVYKKGYWTYSEKKHFDVKNKQLDVHLRKYKPVTDFLYIGGYYQFKGLESYGFMFGFYLDNYNVEYSYSKSEKTTTVFWVGDQESGKASSGYFESIYQLESSHSVLIGRCINFGENIRLTPQVGISYNKIKEISKTEYGIIAESKDKQKTYTVNGYTAVRLEISPLNHVVFFIAPQYGITIKQGSVAKQMTANTSLLDDWNKDFNLRAGIILYL